MKKTLLSLIIMCFMAFSIVLAGCSPKGLAENPATDASTISNGGMTVVKGDYLYFVNGYVDETNLTKDDNKFGKVSNSAIYRTKLVDGEIVKDQDGFLETEPEVVVPKVVGFSNGGFYIIDDYIYYTTPYMNLDRDGVLQTDRVEFHRININGTDDKTIYVTSTNEDNLDWTLYKCGETVYISTYVDSTLIIVNTDSKETVAEIKDCTSYALLKEETYKTGMAKENELHNYIYYTRNITAEDNLSVDYTGNIMCRVNVATGESSIVNLSESKQYKYTIKYVNANSIYYTKQDSKIAGLELLYAKKLNKSWTNATEEKVTNIAYTSYYFCDFGDNLVIASNANGTFLVEAGVSKQILSTETTILDVDNGYAYYATDNKLSRFQVRGELVDGAVKTEEVTDSSKTHLITNSKYIDFDSSRVYVYCDYTSANSSINTYLNYVQPDLTERFVGLFESDHLPEKPEQEEDSEEYIPHID